MELTYWNSVTSFTFLFVLTLFLVLKKFISNKYQLPSGPPTWPVIGNILDLGSNPNQSLYKLRFKYGDLLWLRMGWTNTLVIQTANAAKELFKSHDASFCDRFASETLTAHNFNEGLISADRYGSNWRILRRIVTLGLMTSKRIHETACLRRKVIDDMIQTIEVDSTTAKERGESGEIQLLEYVYNTTFNLIGNLVLSSDVFSFQSQNGIDCFQAINKVMKLAMTPNLADFFPFLKRFDPQRIKKNMEKHIEEAFSIVERFVLERIEERKSRKEIRDVKDLLDTFLEYNESGQETISTDKILSIILEMYIAGTETTSTTIEWAMTELFRNPESMKCVREELYRVVGARRKVEDSDLDELMYLQAVIKETMRLHPVVSMLIPRNTLKDANFMGYFIPKNTQVFVNAWAIGRDPDAWEDPLCFKPERFIGSNIQYKGQHFELIPFGAGRRMCVGYRLAHQMLHLTVASLVHSFDWEIDNNSVADAMDISERFGTAVKKLIPLKVIPKKKTMES